MPYIGNASANRFVASKAATQFSGDGSTTAFTLDHSVGADEDILVSVDGVIQEPSVAYAVSSGTTLTFTAAPSSNSGNNIFVYYLFRTVATVDHPSTSSLQATDATFTGAVTANAGVVVDDITIDGTEIDLSSGDLTIDVAGDIILDADGEDIIFKDAGTEIGRFSNSGSGNLSIKSSVSDKDIFFKGNDGGSTITALTLDMSANGDATFNSQVIVPQYVTHQGDGNTYLEFNTDQIDLYAGGVNGIKIDSAGHVTKPNQSAFSVQGTAQSNIATDASNVAVQFSSERFDQNSDFASHTFTAPVTGKYLLSLKIRIDSVDTAADYYITTIDTSNQKYKDIIDPNFSSDLVYFTQTITVVADMDASDTATVRIQQSSGTAQTDISGNAQYTYFSGYLLG